MRYAIANQLLVIGAVTNTHAPNISVGYGSDLLLVVSGINSNGAEYFEISPSIDILGQGVAVPGIELDNDPYPYMVSNGNSWVMPQIAGLAALIWSVPDFSNWSVEQVVARILGTADTSSLTGNADDYVAAGLYGAGRYDAAAAVDENVSIAPPTFEESLVRFNEDIFGITVDEPLEAIWLYSRQLFSIESFIDPANWELRWDGGDDNWDVYETINIEPMQDYSIGSRWASIDIKENLQNGNYRLIAKASGLQDPFGQALDGDGNLTGGDDFTYDFEYTGYAAPQPQPEPFTETILLGSKNEAMTFAFRFELDPAFVFRNAFDRATGQYEPGTWTLEVDWGDGSDLVHIGYKASTISTEFSHHFDEPGTYTVQFSASGSLQYESATTEIVVVIDELGHLATVDHANGVKDLLIWGTEDEDFIKIEIDDLVMTVYGESTEVPSVIIDDFVLTGIDGRAGVFLYGGNDTFFGEDTPFAIEAHGGHGDDEINTGFGNDSLGGWVDGDTILSELGNDTLRGGPGNDYLVDFGGLDVTLYGVDEGAWNWLYGGDGDDSIVMISGWNVAWGDSGSYVGNDNFKVSSGRSFQIGGAGADTFLEADINPNNTAFGEHLVITGIYRSDWSTYDDPMFSYDGPMEWGIKQWFANGTGTSFADRVATISGSIGSFTGEELIADLTIVDDGEIDIITNNKSTPVPFLNIFPKTWYFLGFAEDIYYSQNAPNTGEVFSNTSPVAIDAVFSDDPSDHVDFTFSAGDAVRHTTTGTVALAAEFNYIYRIDWDDDGTIDETLPGGNGVTTSHGYSDGNVYVTRIDAKSYATPVDPTYFILAIGTSGDDTMSIDYDAGTTGVLIINTAFLTTTRVIDEIVVLAEAGNDTILFGTMPTDVKVRVEGDDGDDGVLIDQLGNNRVTLHGGNGADVLAVGNAYNSFISMRGGAGDDALVLFDYTSNTRAFLDGEEDSDLVGILSLLASTSSVITALGGAGDDTIIGGNGSDFLEGGLGNDLIVGGVNYEQDGDDTIYGGDGYDVIIGGMGADLIYGNDGQDLIVSSGISLNMLGEEEVPGIIQVLQEWLSTETFVTRIQRINNLTESDIDPEFRFIVGQTVLDDGQADTIHGGADEDWVLMDVGEDTFVDEETQDEVTDIGS